MKQKLFTDLRIVAVEKCLDYILENEEQDFKENPSNTHVYYWAMVAAYGQQVADDEFKQAIEMLNLCSVGE